MPPVVAMLAIAGLKLAEALWVAIVVAKKKFHQNSLLLAP